MTTFRSTSNGRRIGAVAGSGALLATGSGALLATTTAPAGAATTFTVSNTTDCSTAGCGSLRQAITDANAAGGKDTIVFQSGLSGTIALTANLPTITEAVDILGNDAITIDGGWRYDGASGSGYRVFYFSDVTGSVTISNLTITGANNTYISSDSLGSTSAGGGFGSAIGVNNDGTATAVDVTIDSMTIRANYATYSAISLDDLTGGTVVISNSTVTGNFSNSGGGAVFIEGYGTTAQFRNDIFDGNRNNFRGCGAAARPAGRERRFHEDVRAACRQPGHRRRTGRARAVPRQRVRPARPRLPPRRQRHRRHRRLRIRGSRPALHRLTATRIDGRTIHRSRPTGRLQGLR